MLADLVLLASASGMMLVAFWLVPPSLPSVRCWILVVGSCALIFSISPYGALVTVAASLICAIWSPVLADARHRRKLTLAALSVLVPLTLWRHVLEQDPLVHIGAAFTTLRSLSVLADSAWRRTIFSVRDVLFLNLFFPTFAAGPIETARNFGPAAFASRFSLERFLVGALRILVGLFKMDYLANRVLFHLLARFWPDAAAAPDGVAAGLFYVLIRFLWVYVQFSGLTDVAIGTAQLFHITVRENFDNPLIAVGIRDFWRRWHRSLADWVVGYIYLPTVRRTGRVELSIFVAFTLIGLWHRLTLLYLAWGCAHGAALGLSRLFRNRFRRATEMIASPVLRPIGWGLTMLFVATVSAIADSSDSRLARLLEDTIGISSEIARWFG